jgi:hypothetical protein
VVYDAVLTGKVSDISEQLAVTIFRVYAVQNIIFLGMQANSSAMLIIHQSTWCHIPQHFNLVTCVTSALQNTEEIHDNRLHHSVHKMEILPKL